MAKTDPTLWRFFEEIQKDSSPYEFPKLSGIEYWWRCGYEDALNTRESYCPEWIHVNSYYAYKLGYEEGQARVKRMLKKTKE